MHADIRRHPVTLADIRRAAAALQGVVIRTPLLENHDVNAMLGGRMLLKAENMQRTGAFKIRGAYYRMLGLSADERARGVVTYSSGNHALGLAQAARILGTSAVIVMPADAPEAKMAAVRALGAAIVAYDRDTQDSADMVAQVMRETGRIEVPPSAHPQVLAGAGTAALELLEDCGHLDAVLVPCGGGGLTAAMAVLMSEASPSTQVYAAEPALFDDTRRSLAAGKRMANPKGQRTICDAIMTPTPGELTFSINRDLLAGGVTATDAGGAQRHALCLHAFQDRGRTWRRGRAGCHPERTGSHRGPDRRDGHHRRQHRRGTLQRAPGGNTVTLDRRLMAEWLGTFSLLATVVGSGIMAERLAGGNVAVALLGNTIPTGAILVVLITIFGPISGAHFNPAVTLCFGLRREIAWGDAGLYVLAQIIGGIAGVLAAHVMFDHLLFDPSTTVRTGLGQWAGEFVATFGLVGTILACLKARPQAVPMMVGLYITAAYWFTSSTSFANPAVTIARGFSNTFAGIAPADVAAFIAVQLVAAVLATWFFRWLLAEPADA